MNALSPMHPLDRLLQLVISGFLIVGVYQFYFWCQRNFVGPPKRLKLPLDDLIPYRPGWVWIYSFVYYPVIVYINFTVQSPGHFLYVAFSYVLLLASQMVFFTFFPVEVPVEWRTCNTRRNGAERFLAFVQRLDGRSNSFPSMHVSVATLTALHLQPAVGPAAFSFPLLIGLSCLFTKQHYVLDVPAGALLGWFVFRCFQWVYP